MTSADASKQDILNKDQMRGSSIWRKAGHASAALSLLIAYLVSTISDDGVGVLAAVVGLGCSAIGASLVPAQEHAVRQVEKTMDVAQSTSPSSSSASLDPQSGSRVSAEATSRAPAALIALGLSLALTSPAIAIAHDDDTAVASSSQSDDSVTTTAEPPSAADDRDANLDSTTSSIPTSTTSTAPADATDTGDEGGALPPESNGQPNDSNLVDTIGAVVTDERFVDFVRNLQANGGFLQENAGSLIEALAGVSSSIIETLPEFINGENGEPANVIDAFDELQIVVSQEFADLPIDDRQLLSAAMLHVLLLESDESSPASPSSNLVTVIVINEADGTTSVIESG